MASEIEGMRVRKGLGKLVVWRRVERMVCSYQPVQKRLSVCIQVLITYYLLLRRISL